MKIWLLKSPHDPKFAYATGVGASWDPKGHTRLQPLIIEWEPGSTLIGDFNVCGPGIFVKRDVADELLRLGVRGFEPGPVLVRENSERSKRRAKNRVPFPYQGPALAELWITKWVHMDPERTTYEEKRLSDGTVDRRLIGFERDEVTWARTAKGPERTARHIPREPGKGLYVKKKELAGCQLFKVHEFPGVVNCTDEFKDLVESKGYSNIVFSERGEVI